MSAALCHQAMTILVEEYNVQPLKCPVSICGDILGQFYVSLSCLGLVEVLLMQIISSWENTIFLDQLLRFLITESFFFFAF
ncbi:putative protein-serine/threonine phosphatase [Helianthus annuus]|nr:putative protein-serine/threonine phosphatase [Helianthus annuus]